MTRPLNYRNGLWLGTKEYARFVPAPARGAAVTPTGWDEDATGKNGGGYVSQSVGRHQVIQYDWSRSTDRQYANYIQGLRDGLYGRGLIHFTDPTSYETNVLPAFWASPGMALGYEAPPLVFRKVPDEFYFGRSDRDNSPMRGATYKGIPNQFNIADALYVPIPPGMAFLFGTRYESNNTATGVYVQPVDMQGGMNTSNRVLMPRGINLIQPMKDLVTHSFSSVQYGGVYIWLGRTSSVSVGSFISVLDMVGKLVPVEALETDIKRRYDNEPWYGGEGNTGMKFLGRPTIVEAGLQNTEISATFKEVGAWELASRL